jgi:hypothetical protein
VHNDTPFSKNCFYRIGIPKRLLAEPRMQLIRGYGADCC